MGASVRFIHTADLHLGAPFKRVGAEDAEVRERLLAASEIAFRRIIDVAIDREVDFVVIAGDALDGSEPRPQAQLLFQREMNRLAERGIAVYAVRGNHDPADGYSAGLELPDTFHYFSGDRVERIVHERDGVPVCSLYGRSYPIRQVTDDYASQYARDASDVCAVGVLHTNVGGREGCEPYAPASAEALRSARMDYWALGHVHGFERVLDDPPAVYSGSPQGIDPAETGAHGCVLVSIEDGSASLDFLETAAIRWESITVDVSAADGIDDVCQYVNDAIGALSAATSSSGVIARLRLEGRTQAHALIAGEASHEDLLASMREQGTELSPWVWIDRLTDATAGTVDVEGIAAGEGFLADLVGHAGSIDPEESVADVLSELRSQLVVFPELEIAPDDIVAMARDACLDLLIDDGGSV